MTPERVRSFLEFLSLADTLKHVERRGFTRAPDGTERRENVAEHCWHLAILAILMHEEVRTYVDLGRVLSMLAVHDLVEIEAGDTFAYDLAGLETQAERERAAADIVFRTLPPELNVRLRGLWEEFERQDTAEARFAMACDRTQGFLQQFITGGRGWIEAGVTRQASKRRMDPARAVDPAFDDLLRTLYARAEAGGMLN